MTSFKVDEKRNLELAYEVKSLLNGNGIELEFIGKQAFFHDMSTPLDALEAMDLAHRDPEVELHVTQDAFDLLEHVSGDRSRYHEIVQLKAGQELLKDIFNNASLLEPEELSNLDGEKGVLINSKEKHDHWRSKDPESIIAYSPRIAAGLLK